MNKNKKMHGEIVSKEEASKGLGFNSVEEMDFFYDHIAKLEDIIEKSLTRWFGPHSSQIDFEVGSKVVDYIMENFKEVLSLEERVLLDQARQFASYNGVYVEYDLISVLAGKKGWKPLMLDEEMVITIHNKKYKITRIQ